MEGWGGGEGAGGGRSGGVGGQDTQGKISVGDGEGCRDKRVAG